MVRVKICGCGHPEDVAMAVDAGADAIGVISNVTVETPRAIPPERAASIRSHVPPFVTTVLVTMPTSIADAVATCEMVRPDVVQLHESEQTPAISALADALDVPMILATDPADERLGVEALPVEAILLDSLREDGGGGTGETHDWERSREIVDTLELPIILAGGLNAGNVAKAIEAVEPFAVDVASGVEASPGQKDPAAVRSFVAAATGGLS